jgi:hypothetical protein
MRERDPWPAFDAFVPAVLRGVPFVVGKDSLTDPNWMYDSSIDGEIWQGDVLPNGVAAFIDREGIVQEYNGPVIVLSNGCDVVPDRDLVATVARVCPVFS